ncbi:recombinase family protein [Alicyclobacillus mali]|uniref:Recombinase family protein n=1 Tax=Alicyclobacillus mali (ex Roth et al. 2021) TaxID=1123961 RepID=A0ABS0F139_9BACL|nr:recombinase family protein [Alicyclobacillus mali (ex Roth et al. 2021)]MBF8376982.1 recombinase family protein [Alicyclobacillus mali (ex Roth et al. 2021)]MCL6488914.1 recombinase family protein [Alicyclobacillus mali (ex Roth et al. 2021)]
MWTAVYTRVSTEHQAQSGHGLDVQREACVQYAGALGVPLCDIRIYEEAGGSGEDMDRPELLRLLDDVRRGLVDRVVVKHPDRLSRNVADKAIVVRELSACGVKLHFVDVPNWDESDEAVLLFHVISSIAEYELRQIRRRTLAGKLRAVRDGKVMPSGVDPYGYRYEGGRYAVVPEEAEIVRLIYRWYAFEHMSLRAIADRLDAMGVPTKTRRSARWHPSTVARILDNPLYQGIWYYNRRRTRKRERRGSKGLLRGRGRQVVSVRDPSEWIGVPVPAVVDAELARLVALRKRSEAPRGSASRHTFLSGKLVCAHCQRAWRHEACRTASGMVRKFRRPPAERGAASCPYACGRVSACEVEEAVWRELVRRARAWGFGPHFAGDLNEGHPLDEDAARLRRELRAAVERRDRARELYLRGHLERSEALRAMSEEMRRLRAGRDEACRLCHARQRRWNAHEELWKALEVDAGVELRRMWLEALVSRVEIDASGDEVVLTLVARVRADPSFGVDDTLAT